MDPTLEHLSRRVSESQMITAHSDQIPAMPATEDILNQALIMHTQAGE